MDFHFRKFDISGVSVALQLWDIAGQDRFGAMYRVCELALWAALRDARAGAAATPGLASPLLVRRAPRPADYKDAFGAVLVFDLSREETFTNVLKWKREIDSKVTLPNGKPLPVVLLANKCDLPEASVRREQLDGFCKEHGFIGWFETSAKTNHNIEESIRGLVSSILSHPGAPRARACAWRRRRRRRGASPRHAP